MFTARPPLFFIGSPRAQTQPDLQGLTSAPYINSGAATVDVGTYAAEGEGALNQEPIEGIGISNGLVYIKTAGMMNIAADEAAAKAVTNFMADPARFLACDGNSCTAGFTFIDAVTSQGGEVRLAGPGVGIPVLTLGSRATFAHEALDDVGYLDMGVFADVFSKAPGNLAEGGKKLFQQTGLELMDVYHTTQDIVLWLEYGGDSGYQAKSAYGQLPQEEAFKQMNARVERLGAALVTEGASELYYLPKDALDAYKQYEITGDVDAFQQNMGGVATGAALQAAMMKGVKEASARNTRVNNTQECTANGGKGGANCFVAGTEVLIASETSSAQTSSGQRVEVLLVASAIAIGGMLSVSPKRMRGDGKDRRKRKRRWIE